MKCDKCLTEVRFGKNHDLFFFTPQEKTPCDACKAKFDHIRKWTDKMPVELNVAMVAEFANSVRELRNITADLASQRGKRSLWSRIKKFFSFS